MSVISDFQRWKEKNMYIIVFYFCKVFYTYVYVLAIMRMVLFQSKYSGLNRMVWKL